MLTNEVQTAYAETEGYVPVTTKAQESPEYLDYLSRAGEDNKVHYDIKLLATQLLLDNIENTFVTPVFNGSASVRDAAGQMIENVAKSVRRKETVDAAYMEKLEKDISSLYRLDRLGPSSGEGEGASSGASGELPAASKALLITLCAVWILLAGYGVYTVLGRLKKKKD
jgi:multiple sugar transport system substrate-binding protein